VSDLYKFIIENLTKIVTSVASAGLLALLTYLCKRGSWTKEHKRARLHEVQGDKCSASGLLSAAIDHYKSAMAVWEGEMNQPRMLDLYHKMGCAYRKIGDAERALEALTHCEMIWDSMKKQVKIQEVYFELAQVYLLKRQLDKAANYIAQSIAVLRSQDSPRLPIALSMAARIAKERGRPEEAENDYVEAVRILENIGDIVGLATIYSELADLKQAHGSSEIAKQYYERSAEAFERLGSARAVELRAKLAGA
jgi:tetratricopeptide (TPR) repeat protein